MVSLLESKISELVTAGFKGQLLTGTLRRVTVSSVNNLGDPSSTTPTTFSFNGIVENISKAFSDRHGIPITDVSVLIIAGSLSTVPVKDDQIKIRNEWYQLRRLLERDPANATYLFAGFVIPDPT